MSWDRWLGVAFAIVFGVQLFFLPWVAEKAWQERRRYAEEKRKKAEARTIR